MTRVVRSRGTGSRPISCDACRFCSATILTSCLDFRPLIRGGLRVADRIGQHRAQFCLRHRGLLSGRRFPLGHNILYGDAGAEIKPPLRARPAITEGAGDGNVPLECLTGKSPQFPVQPSREKFPAFAVGQIKTTIVAILSHSEGRWPSSRTLGQVVVDAAASRASDVHRAVFRE